MVTIGKYLFNEFVNQVKEFHGFSAPGVIMGGMMVDLALTKIPPGTLFNALCETEKCLPDAIQLLTPCTIGNGWLTITNVGRFAFALYDKDSGQGIRVVLNPAKVEQWPEIKDWYYKLKSKEEVDLTELLNSIGKSGHDLYTIQEIKVQPDLLVKRKRGKRVICPQCREAYPFTENGLCLACQGNSPYVEGELK